MYSGIHGDIAALLEAVRRTASAHSGRIGRASGPDSPPTMTHWMPFRSSGLRPSSKGSTDRKRTRAGTWHKFGRVRSAYPTMLLILDELWEAATAAKPR